MGSLSNQTSANSLERGTSFLIHGICLSGNLTLADGRVYAGQWQVHCRILFKQTVDNPSTCSLKIPSCNP
eukprot:5865679-Amphidinium_carterae.1